MGYSRCLQSATLGGYCGDGYSGLLLVITVGYSCLLQWATLGDYSGLLLVLTAVVLTEGYT